MKNLYTLLLIFSFGFAQVPSTWWVDAANGSDSNDGKTEATAYKTIQKVFNSYLLSNYVDTIKVKPGTYSFDNGYISNLDKPFVMQSTGGADQTIFDADKKNNHFYMTLSSDSTIVFDGITFKNGETDNFSGGAFTIYGTSKVDFRNCVFENNKSNYGGGAVYVGSSSQANFESCTFKDNETTNTGGAINYEMPYDEKIRNSYAKVYNSTFINNRVKSETEAIGGAIQSQRQIEIINSVFADNYVEGGKSNFGYTVAGGAVMLEVSSYNPQTQQYIGGNAKIINSTFDGNYVNSKSTYMGSAWAGTISYGRYNQASSKTFIFNSIVSNSRLLQNGEPYNRDDQNSSYGEVIGTGSDYFKVYVDYSNIQGGVGQSWAGNQVYDINPGFKNPANRDYSLSDKSPLIGAGVATWSDWDLKAPSKDILSKDRPAPSGSSPDLGAYENANATFSGPMPVSSFSAKAISFGAKLRWGPSKKSLASNENAENITYKVYQDSSSIAEISDTAYTITGLKLGTTYTFSVSAFDKSANLESVIVGPVSITPTYLGPWYVATSGGKSPDNEQNTNLYGTKEEPIINLISAIEVAAKGDTIIMMEGTHTGAGNRNITINKKLVISGELDKGPEKSIIDAEGRSRHFKFNNEAWNDQIVADSSWVIQNLTLSNGKVVDPPPNAGGWVDFQEARGGSVLLTNSNSPRFYKVIFRANVDETTSYNGAGAIHVQNGSTLNVDGCEFINNKHLDLDNSVSGGAIGISSFSESVHTINASIFKGNKVSGKYGASGAAVASNEPINIFNSVFYNNETTASEGSVEGAIMIDGGNHQNGNHSLIVNNTIVNNYASTSASWGNTSALYYRDWTGQGQEKHTLYAFNNIVYGNLEGQDLVAISVHGSDAEIRADYNLLQNLDNIESSANLSFDYSYNFDPAFKDSANGDFSLSNFSQALGRGIANWNTFKSLNAPAYDILGVERPSPVGSNPDLGAFENALGKSPAPPQVTGLTAKGGSGQIDLAWNSMAEADSIYKVYQYDKPFTALTNETLVAKPTLPEYVATGLDNAKRYYFKVTAVNKAGYESAPASIDLSPTHTGPVWWVATDGNDQTGDGSSAVPLASIQKAMERAASGDTIMLKPGRYKTAQMNYPFSVFDNTTGQSTFKKLDSLVIRSQKGSAVTILDADYQDRHFEFYPSGDISVDSSFQFIGLTFRGGRSPDRGGSFLLENNSHGGGGSFPGFEPHSSVLRPKFVDCIFVDNASGGGNQFYGQGGAFYMSNASPIFESCEFDSNFANSGGALYFGGNADHDADTTLIRNSSFKSNAAFSDNSEAMGGAINVQSVQKLLITGSTFKDNSAVSNGFTAKGGALYISSDWDPFSGSFVEASNSRFNLNLVFSQNSAADGGAIYVGAPFKMYGSVVDSNSVGSGGNNEFGVGGGIYIDQYPVNKSGGSYRGYVELVHNTIVNNVASGNGSYGGGIVDMSINDHDNYWYNNIIWGNISESNAPDRGVGFGMNGNQSLNNLGRSWNGYNNIQDVVELQQMHDFEFGDYTYSVDPSFKVGSFQLSDASPLIGAGVEVVRGNVTLATTDIDGNRRPTPSNSNPDIGAYENALAKSPYPDQVRDVVAEALTKSVKVSWKANAAQNIKHYNVYYSQDKTVNRAELTKAGSTDSTELTVSGLFNGTEYHFVVSAEDTLGFEGPFSEMVSAVPKYGGPNWWVDPTASFDGDGSFSDPFQTIGRAVIEIAERGDTIRLKAGTYFENNIFFSSRHMGGPPGGGQHQQNLVKEIAIIGMGGVENTIIDADYGQSHFMADSLEKLTISGLSLVKGFTDVRGGALQMREVDSLFVRNSKFVDNTSQNGGGAIALDAVRYSMFKNVQFLSNRVSFDGTFTTNGEGGAVVIFNQNEEVLTNTIFDHCYFEDNGITSNANQASANGGVMHVGGSSYVWIHQSQFVNNYIQVQGGNTSFSNASLLAVHGFEDINSWNDAPQLSINQSLIAGNFIQSDGNSNSVLIESNIPVDFVNNLVVNNRTINDVSNSIFRLGANQDKSGSSAVSNFYNNTFFDNTGASNFIDVFGENEYINITNNIIWSNNTGQNESSNFYKANTVTMYVNNNIFESTVQGNFTSVDNILEDPKLRNPNNGDFRLQGNSPGIDAGADVQEIFDFRGYYRVGVPDIGAFESGASKYILAIQDDIVGDKDTTFVTRNDTLEFTVTTNDINGNIVDSNENVQWSIFPSAKYVNLISSDPTTSGGSATARFKVSQQARSKGFRFRIEAEIGDAIMRSEMYVIEELVTGAPPPVPVLSISPNEWTAEPNFTLSWTIPNWSEGRDLLGAIVEINDGVNFYDEFIGFPENNPLKAYAFTVPEPGAFDASIRLMDEYGNEDRDSSKTVQALFDNIPPESFRLNGPNSYSNQNGEIETNWVSDVPRFEWQNFGDYPSGIKAWILYVNNSEFGTYYENDIDFVEQDAAIEDTSKRFEDGTYEWHLVAIDQANNETFSDTAFFGVDLNPPLIVHNNPLTSVDEGSTTPSINVQVSDGGSGVSDVYLNYRRSGSNSGFVTVQLWKDGEITPSSIPGNDIRSEGVEYFIEAFDQLGNRSEWPYDYNGNDVQSVVARTQDNVTTASYWTAGIPTGTDTSAYQLFSIPFKTNKGLNAVTEVLGPPDEFKYRLYSYNNGFEEFTEFNSIDIGLGKSYFFIWDKEQYPDVLQLNFDFGKGESTPTSPPFEIPAAVGEWKFFGNPYNFPVDWIDVRGQNDIPIFDGGSVYTWSNFGGWVSPGQSLEPWKGYIYKSATDPDIYVDGTGNIFGKRLAKSKTPDLHNITMDANEWMINILASTGRSRDESNTVGVLNIAKDGYDQFDEFEPPVVPGNISVAIDNRNREEVPDLFSTDMRRANEDGHYWDLEVLAPTNGQKTYLTFEGIGYVPDEYDVFIINKTNKQAQNLKWESTYRFANSGSKSYLKQDLRLVVGTKEFVQENNAGISLYPDAFVLSQNYPNPFNPQTSIMISLEEDARVDMVIYSLLGEEVVRLASNEFRPAGYYNFIWNGLNASGLKVSTGVYLYHATVRDKSGRIVLNKTKKMVYLK